MFLNGLSKRTLLLLVSFGAFCGGNITKALNYRLNLNANIKCRKKNQGYEKQQEQNKPINYQLI